MQPTLQFAVVDALVQLSTESLPSLQVVDGPRVTKDPGDYLLIGVDDPTSGEFAEVAESQQSWAGLGARARDEQGDVWCVAESRVGGTDMKAARDAAAATMSAVQDLIQADPSLGGVLSSGWAGFGSTVRTRSSQAGGAATVRVAFQVRFQGRL